MRQLWPEIGKIISALPALEAFQYRRWVDHSNEGGLKFALWTNAQNTTQNIGGKKPSWVVPQSAGIGDETTVFETYKLILGIKSRYLSGWSEIIKTIPTDLTAYNLDFVVKAEGTPVEGAVVEFSGNRKKTDDQGHALFYNVVSLPDMLYLVNAPNYDSDSGQVNVTEDKEIEINSVYAGIEDNPDEQWQFYPNLVISEQSLKDKFPGMAGSYSLYLL